LTRIVLISLCAALALNLACSPSETCGAGTVQQGGSCVAVDAGPSLTCGAGTVLSNGQCVGLDAGPGVTCGAGAMLVGGECVPVDAGPGIVCGAGTMLVGNACVAVDAGPGVTCGAGTVLMGGSCVGIDGGPISTMVVVTSVGLGTGTVTGTGLACAPGGACTATVTAGTPYVLTAVADPGYFFVGWRGGGCSGTGTCSVTPSGNTSIEAGFAAVTYWGSAQLPDGGVGGSGVFGISLDGGASTELVGPGDPWLLPTWTYASSADGMVFSFVGQGFEDSNSNATVWVANLWSGESSRAYVARDLPGDGTVPAGTLSPDGNHVALTEGSDLLVMNSDGTNLVNQTTGFVASDYTNGAPTGRYVAWSPDSTLLAWVSTQNVTGETGAYSNVWMAHADGTSVARVTGFNATTISGDPGVTGLDWSPDGTKIAFVSTQAPGTNGTGGATLADSNLWTVTVATKALFCVTNFATEYGLDMATYARTGNSLVFTSKQAPTLGSGAAINSRNLFTIADDGTGLRALTASTASNASSVGQYWAPDGATLVFESNMVPGTPPTTSTGLGIWTVTLAQGATAAPLIMNNSAVNSVYDYSPLDDDD